MKGIEEIIKESVQNYEVPYDSSAWDSLSAKLDAGAKASPKKWPWIAGVAGIAAIVTTVLVLQNQENNTTLNTDKDVSAKTIVDVQESTSPTKHTTKLSEEENTSEENIATQAEETTVIENERNTQTTHSNNSTTPSEVVNETVVEDLPAIKHDPVNQTAVKRFVTGAISETTICKGESITISNNQNGHVLFALDNGVYHLKKGESQEFHPETTSEVKFVNDKGETLASEIITVHKAAPIEFSYENFYVKGVPVTRLQSYSSANTYAYTVDDKQYNGKDVSIHLFDKSNHSVTLTTTDANGCTSETTQNVQNEQDYNLLAVNAFNPNSAINENRTFMPFALTERNNTQFSLTVFDSRDNQIVFQSSNANETWDGTDRRTGRMADANISFIWQVKLQNPLEGEKSAYAGTITIQSNL